MSWKSTFIIPGTCAPSMIEIRLLALAQAHSALAGSNAPVRYGMCEKQMALVLAVSCAAKAARKSPGWASAPTGSSARLMMTPLRAAT